MANRSLSNVTLLILMSFAATMSADEFHIAPDGTSKGDGSKKDPWSLPYALSHPSAIKPGDTLWLHGGTYVGSFFSQLKGQRGQRITLRQAPGERATIDIRPNKQGVGFYAYGEWTRFQGFEITCTNPVRSTKLKGSWPSDLRRGSVECRGSHHQFINLVVHDLGNGFGFWSQGEGGEISGCLIYHNGWSGPDRGHGHAIYAQNETGTKRITDNVIFSQFGDGIDVYGSTKATLKGFHIEGNMSFLNGCLNDPDTRTSDLRVGGECPLQDIHLAHNVVFGGGVQVGYPWGRVNRSSTVVDNYFTGGASFYYPGELVFARNTVVAPGPVVRLTMSKSTSSQTVTINKNLYFLDGSKAGPFAINDGRGRSLDFAKWNERGMDQNSRLDANRPEGVRVFVRPNKFQPGRAHIAVFNWDKEPEVEIDLAAVLQPGTSFQIVPARNFFGDTIFQGQFDGSPIRISMQPNENVQPIGMDDYELPTTTPNFNVFVVLTL